MSTLYVNTITPNSGDTVSISGSLYVSGAITLGDANTDSVSFGAEISSSIIPDADNSYDLGSSAKEWKDLYVDGTGNIDTIIAGTITASIISGGASLTAASITSAGDLAVGDDLSLTSDSAIFNMGAGNDFKITHDGTTGATLSGTPITVDSQGDLTLTSSADVKIGANGGNIEFFDEATKQLTLDMDGTVGAQIIQTNVDGDDLVFRQYDGTEVLRLSDDGSGSFTSDLTVGDDLSLISDSAVFNMGVGNDFTITHDGTTGAVISATPITINSVGELELSGSSIDVNSNGAIAIDGVGLSIDNAGTAANITSTSDADAEDFTISLAGATNSSLKLASSGTGADALQIHTTAGSIEIESADNLTAEVADEISLSTTSADGHISIVTAHTAGQAFHLDANANAGSIVDIDAGILDIDVTGAATVDADSIALTGAVTAVTGVQSSATAVTATDAGAAIPAGTAVALVNADSDANHIVILPAPVVGNIIHIIENGTTGYELRTSTPASIGINGGTASNGESAIAGAITYIRCVCVSSTSWIATQFDADGDESKVEAAA